MTCTVCGDKIEMYCTFTTLIGPTREDCYVVCDRCSDRMKVGGTGYHKSRHVREK